MHKLLSGTNKIEDIKQRIINRLLAKSRTWFISSNGHIEQKENPLNIADNIAAVTLEEIQELPRKMRPQLTDVHLTKDMKEPSSGLVIEYYQKFTKTGNMDFYNRFRQGLDILDLDDMMYQIIDMNIISMGHWLPRIAPAVLEDGFFRIPATKILKVPLPVLQLTRLELSSLTESTLDIVSRYCRNVFELEDGIEYFIKTGTFSAKFNFQNTHIFTPDELGLCLLSTHHQALRMADPMAKPSIYGASTTTEWVVREYIKDIEGCPTIYNGLPLRLEMRVFVDFDEKNIIGISPYWEPETMKKNLSKKNVGDYITFCAMEQKLNYEYEKNKEIVMEHIQSILDAEPPLAGQWSIDVMKAADSFYFIDMSTADHSALKECIPAGLLKKTPENWIPETFLI